MPPDTRPDPTALTEKQRACLDAVLVYRARHGYAPSQRDLQGLLGYASVSSVYHVLGMLERKGYLERDPGVARSLRPPRHSNGPRSLRPREGVPA